MIEATSQPLHAIGWALLHFAWQGAALAALFAALLGTTRNASLRYALGVGTLLLMMAAPVVTFVWLNGSAGLDATIDAQTFAAVTGVTSPEQVVPSERIADVLASGADRQQMILWLVQAWLAGVILLSLRTAGGLLWLRHTRHGRVARLSDDLYQQCLRLQQSMGLSRNIRFGQCEWLDAPAVLGWFRPIVLVTSQAVTGLSPQQLHAIIVHELAHIRRHDAFVNLFQIAAETVLFYHPAVWWVSRRIRIEREVCCDSQALAACAEPVSYARALALMEEWRAAPSMMMAANRGPLTERILRLLDGQGTSPRFHAVRVSTSIVCIVAALFAGNVLLAAAQHAADSKASSFDESLAATRQEEPQPVEAPGEIKPARTPAAPAREPKPPNPPAVPKAPSDDRASTHPSYTRQLAALGFTNLDIDELVAMKVQDVTPEYIESIFATQLRPTAEQFIAMKVHEVTAEDVAETRRLVADPSIDDVIAMKVHEVTPRFIRDIQAAGLDVRTADDLIAVAVHDITPEFVKTAIEHGFKDLTVDRLIMLRNADIL